MTFTLGAVLLVAATVLFILQPLLTGDSATLDRTEDEMTEAESKRRVKLLALRDVEYDYATGKLDEADYQSLRRELSQEALAALEAVEEEGTESAEVVAADRAPGEEAVGSAAVGADAVEREIARVREGLKAGTACISCGHVNRPGSRFCSVCGRPLPAAAPEE